MTAKPALATRYRVWLRRLLPAIITLGLIYLLLRQVDPAIIGDTLRTVTPTWALAGLVCYIINNLFRSLRFMILFPSRQTRLVHLLAVVSGSSLINQILPARTGELSFIVLARKVGMNTGESAASLFLARVFDLMTIAFLFAGMALANIKSLPDETAVYVVIMATVMGIIGLIIISLPRLGGFLLRQMTQIIDRFGGSQTQLGQKLIRVGEHVLDSFAATRSITSYILLFITSLITWLFNFGIMYAFVRSLGIDISYPTLIVGATFANLTNILPISGIGNFGTLEAGWTAGFMLLGFDYQTAIATGFATHILAFLCALMVGLWGLAVLNLRRTA